jgi:hypothetical protein
MAIREKALFDGKVALNGFPRIRGFIDTNNRD